MNNQIQEDFKQFMNDCELFNSDIKLYDKESQLVFEGKGIYDRKPDLVQNEDGKVAYQGHRRLLTLSMAELTFMSTYFSLQGYTAEITDNVGTVSLKIATSSYDSNVNTIFSYLKD